MIYINYISKQVFVYISNYITCYDIIVIFMSVMARSYHKNHNKYLCFDTLCYDTLIIKCCVGNYIKNNTILTLDTPTSVYLENNTMQ